MTSKTSSQNTLLGWLAMGVVLTAGLVMIAAWAILPSERHQTTNASLIVRSVGDQAFGSLTQGQTATPEAAQVDKRAGTTASTGLTIAPAPGVIKQIKFSYTGDIPSFTLPVLRRQTGLGTTAVSNIFRSEFTNLLDASKFRGFEPTQITLEEIGGSRYAMTLDYQAGTIGVYRSVSSELLKASASQPPTPIDPATAVPDDAAMIKIANAWLDQFSISRSGLGKPVVQDVWKRWYLAAQPAERLSYLPTEISVIYPWEIQGRKVYDSSGSLYGLTVTVSVSDKTVTAVSNIVPMKFDASNYELSHDETLIRQAIARGGIYGPMPIDGSDTTEIKVTKPEVVYMVSRYQLDQKSYDYLVPALLLTIEAPTDLQATVPPTMIVPLAKELLDQANVIPDATDDSANGGSGVIEPSPTDVTP